MPKDAFVSWAWTPVTGLVKPCHLVGETNLLRVHPDAVSINLRQTCQNDPGQVMTVSSTQSANKTTSHQLGCLTKPLTMTNFKGRIDTEWTNPYLQKVVLQRRLSVPPQQ